MEQNKTQCYLCKHTYDDHTGLSKNLYMSCGSCTCDKFTDVIVVFMTRVIHGAIAVVVLAALGFYGFLLHVYLKGQL